MSRNIAVVTGTRAEYGILKPLLNRIVESDKLELYLAVTGLHLLSKYGFTINEIRNDGFEIGATVEMYDELRDRDYYGSALATAIAGFTDILVEKRPELLVVFGDRLEPLAATLAAATLGMPIAHIHGGDKTDSGHIDECIRHSISRFAHIHFTATKEHTNRLLKMGEEPQRIVEVGALGLDSVLDLDVTSHTEGDCQVTASFPSDKTIVCIFHPVHLEKELAGKQMREILRAIQELKMPTVMIYPNNDAGSQEIIEAIEKTSEESYVKIFRNLSHQDYIGLLRHAGVLIGNSSSGIIEAPSLQLPVVNIGTRNVGRLHADNVLFVDAKKEDIVDSIKTALYDKEFLTRVKECSNPYGNGKASKKITEVLADIKIDKKLLQKQITY